MITFSLILHYVTVTNIFNAREVWGSSQVIMVASVKSNFKIVLKMGAV